MKSVPLVVALCLAAALAAGCGGDAKKEQAKPAAKIVLKFGHLADEKNTWNLAALRFKELVEKNSAGRIEVQVYPNEQLGKEKDLVTGIQTGTADIGIFGETLTTFGVNKAMLMATPYLIRDAAHLHKVAGGEIGREIEQQILDRAKLRPLAYFERGPRDLTSNRPVRTPDDMEGLRLRVPNVPLYLVAWQALGARPAPLAFSEVFKGLQQGTIEGQENPYALVKSARLYEVQKYLNKTSHVRAWIYVCIGEKRFATLPPDLQKVIADAGKEMQRYENELFLKEEAELEQYLQSKMTFVAVDVAAFQARARDAVLANLDAEQKELYNRIAAVQ